MDKDKVWEAFEKYGVALAVLHYSGGHDEGYVESYDYFNTDNQELKKPFPQAEFIALERILEAPIDLEYSSFAFEGYVSGDLTWDLQDKSVRMDGSEEWPKTESIQKTF